MIFLPTLISSPRRRHTAGTAANVVHRMNAQQRRLFADEIARRFSRFAYPDEVVTVLRPLTEQVRKKAPKGGAVGQVLQRVAKLRLECEPSWDATEALTITLLVIVEPQFLPAVADDYDVEIPAMPAPEIAMDLSRAAEQILACPLHDPRLIELWGAFGRELLLLLEAGESKATPGLVADLDVDVMRTESLRTSGSAALSI